MIFGCRSLKIVPGAALVSVSCPPKSPLDQLAGLAERELASAVDPAQAQSALVVRLSKVPDLRRRRDRRHPLVVVLATVIVRFVPQQVSVAVGGSRVQAVPQATVLLEAHVTTGGVVSITVTL